MDKREAREVLIEILDHIMWAPDSDDARDYVMDCYELRKRLLGVMDPGSESVHRFVDQVMGRK